MSVVDQVSVDLNPYSSINRATVLRLIRDGVVKNRDDLDWHFGLGGTRRDSPVYTVLSQDQISDVLTALNDAGLIEYKNHEWKVTPLLAKLQAGLQLSLSALSSGLPGKRYIVSPQFATYNADRYRSDILVLMPFADVLTALYQDHLKVVA
jgi:hypothetical protein